MFDMDSVAIALVNNFVGRATKVPYETWSPGQKLKILLVGYNGKRNTGADTRVKAIVDQYYRIFGREHIEIGVLTFNIENLQDYFDDDTRLIKFDSIFFKDVLKACSEYHMAVLCE